MWVLILTAAAASGPTGLTSVPGYRSEEACIEAGRAYTARVDKVRFNCIRGPGDPAQSRFTVDWWQNQRVD